MCAEVDLSLSKVTEAASLEIEVGVSECHMQINIHLYVLIVFEIKFVVLDLCLLDVSNYGEVKIRNLIIILTLYFRPEGVS